jgi:branched-subunit amino acid aminotransferase/4-amino-4-deoxychorismate lyase
LYRLNIYVWSDEGVHSQVEISPYNKPEVPLKLAIATGPFDVPDPMRLGLKSLNYERYAAATKKAQSQSCWDMVLYNDQDLVLEGSRSTLYFYMKGMWLTPKEHVVEGIQRKKLLNANRVRAANVSIKNLDSIEAIAVSNALIGIAPVKALVKENSVVWRSTNIILLP